MAASRQERAWADQHLAGEIEEEELWDELETHEQEVATQFRIELRATVRLLAAWNWSPRIEAPWNR